jgi:hypothetical protein
MTLEHRRPKCITLEGKITSKKKGGSQPEIKKGKWISTGNQKRIG